MAPATLTCPHCGDSTADAHFCEGCGGPLRPVTPAPVSTAPGCVCGSAFDADGFCAACGRKAPDPRDHLEEAVGDRLAAATDRGRRHRHNEDDFAIGAHARGSVLVVSDGVSSASNSNLASRAAARAARDELLRALKAGQEPKLAVASAVMRAHQAALKIPSGDDGRADPPGATIVAAVVVEGAVVVGWAGDSRAYWLGENRAMPITRDHSWLVEAVDAGIMDLAEATNDPRAHAITQCIGELNEGRPEMGIALHTIEEPGWLLLCSDGLWGYVPEAEALRALLTGATPLENARLLVDFALCQGGVDNVTVALLHIPTFP